MGVRNRLQKQALFRSRRDNRRSRIAPLKGGGPTIQAQAGRLFLGAVAFYALIGEDRPHPGLEKLDSLRWERWATPGITGPDRESSTVNSEDHHAPQKPYRQRTVPLPRSVMNPGSSPEKTDSHGVGIPLACRTRGLMDRWSEGTRRQEISLPGEILNTLRPAADPSAVCRITSFVIISHAGQSSNPRSANRGAPSTRAGLRLHSPCNAHGGCASPCMFGRTRPSSAQRGLLSTLIFRRILRVLAMCRYTASQLHKSRL